MIAVGGVGAGDLDIVAADGSGVRKIKARGREQIWTVAFSPDGQQLAAAVRAEGASGPRIELISPAGADRRPFPGIPAGSFDPAWAPNGKRLAFATSASFPLSPQLSTISADGSGLKHIASNASSPAWSASGHQIAFARSVSGAPTKIYTVRAGGGTPRFLSQVGPGQPAFAPNGEIAFADDHGGISIVPSAGGQLRTLVRKGSSPEWSPDGKFLAFLRPVACDREGCAYRIFITDAAAKSPPKAIGPPLRSVVSALRLSWGRRLGE